MQILGNYQSTLSSSYYQQLVTLLQQAIQAGDFGGGQTFDQAALVALQQAGAELLYSAATFSRPGGDR